MLTGQWANTENNALHYAITKKKGCPEIEWLRTIKTYPRSILLLRNIYVDPIGGNLRDSAEIHSSSLVILYKLIIF